MELELLVYHNRQLIRSDTVVDLSGNNRPPDRIPVTGYAR
jgi:hypothetical protein